MREALNPIEWARYLADQCLVFPAATFGPAALALRAATVIGAADALLPVATSRTARRELHAAGLRGAALDAGVRERLAWPRRDLVWRQRFRTGKEHPGDWRLIEVDPGPVRELLGAKRSFIAAGGHFTSAAADLRHLVLPMAGAAVGGALPSFSFNPFELRRRLDAHADQGAREVLMGLQTGGRNAPHLNAVVPDIWDRTSDWTSAPPFPNIQDQVLHELTTPGAVSQILIDAYWEKPGAYRRAFAGIGDRGFALGAARIARLAQCPVVPFVAVFGEAPRTVSYEWGKPIWPGPRDDKSRDALVIDAALEFLERGVAKYPTQYLHPIGYERAWNSNHQAWLQRR